MQINEEKIQEYIQLYKQEYNIEISHEKAHQEFLALLIFMEAVHKYRQKVCK